MKRLSKIDVLKYARAQSYESVFGMNEPHKVRGPLNMLTQDQVDDHVLGKENTCPRCGTTEVKSGDMWETYDGYMYRKRICEDCGLQWNDVYEIYDVDIVKEES